MWPSEKLAIAVFANQVSELTYQATAMAAEAIAGITGTPLQGPPPTTGRDPTAAERAELLGTYQLGQRTFTIEESEGRLVHRLRGPVPITMTGRDRFVAAPNGVVTEFQVIRDAAGRVHYLFNGLSAFPRVRTGQ